MVPEHTQHNSTNTVVKAEIQTFWLKLN